MCYFALPWIDSSDMRTARLGPALHWCVRRSSMLPSATRQSEAHVQCFQEASGRHLGPVAACLQTQCSYFARARPPPVIDSAKWTAIAWRRSSQLDPPFKRSVRPTEACRTARSHRRLGIAVSPKSLENARCLLSPLSFLPTTHPSALALSIRLHVTQDGPDYVQLAPPAARSPVLARHPSPFDPHSPCGPLDVLPCCGRAGHNQHHCDDSRARIGHAHQALPPRQGRLHLERRGLRQGPASPQQACKDQVCTSRVAFSQLLQQLIRSCSFRGTTTSLPSLRRSARPNFPLIPPHFPQLAGRQQTQG